MRYIPFLRGQLAGRLPQIVNEREEAALELFGFSEYIVDPSPAHIDKINELAEKIIRSQQTKDPIVDFRVEGHADVPLKVPIEERKQFAEEISTDRADNAFLMLVEALKQKGGEAAAKRIAKYSKAFGMGFQHLKVKGAFTEEQFAMNRRVVFFTRRVTVIPPPPEPAPPAPSIVEERFSVRLLKAVNLTVGALHVLESFTLGAHLEVTDLIDKKKATFHVLATGGGFSVGPGRAGGQATFSPGPAVKFKVFRLLGSGRPNINLKSFEGAVTVFVDWGAGAGTVSQGGTLSFSFDALETAGCNTQPQVIPLPGGSDSHSTPSAGLGDVLPLGRMTMIGEPTSI